MSDACMRIIGWHEAMDTFLVLLCAFLLGLNVWQAYFQKRKP